jgi:pimeloyl-ACP methyl ester carboxylesterase
VRARVTVLLTLLTLLVPPAQAVEPADKYAVMPKSTGLEWSAVSFKSTRDAADLNGWWFEGKPDAPVLVLFDRAKGNMGDLIPVVAEFAGRGFTVMTFDYRDFGPAGPGSVDSLLQLAYASRWVNDAEGALRFAREKAGARPVFAWGQDLGGAIAVAAGARDRRNADAISCEGLFRTLAELLRSSGLSQIAGVPERHRFLVETTDEPLPAVGSLLVPLHVTIAMKDDVWPATVTQEVTRRSLSRIDRWNVPEGKHLGLEQTPGYYDRVGGWFTRIAGMIKASAPPPAAAPVAAPQQK